jgi:cation transport ATPase
LHDRATRGQDLPPEEEEQLAAWYAAQDRAEMAELGLSASETAASLQAQINAAKKIENAPSLHQRLRETSGSVAELSGMLASVCAAFLVFLLSPGLFPKSNAEGLFWEIVLVLLFLAATAYSASAAYAIWTSIYTPRPNAVQMFAIRSASLLVMGTIFFVASITMLFWLLQHTIAFYVALVVIAFGVLGILSFYAAVRHLLVSEGCKGQQ